MDDVSRGESGREDDVPFYDNMESDETEEESGEIRKAIISNSEKLSGNVFSLFRLFFLCAITGTYILDLQIFRTEIHYFLFAIKEH